MADCRVFKRLGVLFLSLASSVAIASPDLTVRIVSQPSLEQVNGATQINFEIEYANSGDVLSAEVSSKALLVPINDYENAPGLKGTVLPTFTETLNLANGESVVKKVSLPLPTMPYATYLFGVTTDTGATTGETYQATLNNVTADMLYVGTISSYVEDARNPINDIDCYHEVHSKFSLTYGQASHRSRMIVRGAVDGIPNTIYGRFLLVDLANQKLYLAPYMIGTTDKFWGAISWNNEVDAEGRPIKVDYYTNSPYVDHIPAGKYLMGVLVNVRDRFAEAYPENNLDLTALDIHSPVLSENKEVWLVKDEANPNPRAYLNFHSRANVSEQGRSYYAENLDSWFTMEPNQGMFSADLSIVQSEFTVQPDLSPGEYSSMVRLVEEGYEMIDVPVRVFVYGDSKPEMQLSSMALSFESMQGINPEPQAFAISNTGTETLKFSMSEEEHWMFVYPMAGEVGPGESVIISLYPIHYALSPSQFYSRITIYNNASNEASAVDVTYTVNQRN